MTDAILLMPENKPRKRRIRWSRNIAFLLVAAAIISAFTTYTVMTRTDNPLGPDSITMIGLAIVNLGLLLSLIAVVAQRAYRLWLELRKGSVGSRLQTRIVVMFSLITMVPTLTVAVFAALFMHAGIQSWFSDRVNTGLEESVAVAEAYLNEHRDNMKTDVRIIAADVEREMYRMGGLSTSYTNNLLSTQAQLRGLSEAAVLQRGQVIAHTNMTFSLAFENMPAKVLEYAETGQTVVIADDDKIRAVVKLSAPQTYLIIGQLIDKRVVDHVENAQQAVNEYRGVRNKISSIQIQFSILFVLVALLLLLSAIWYGMFFAARLAKPITRLVEAAERVRAGDYATRVGEGPENDELATLGRAFNRMTNQLASQRRDLMKANRQIDARRRFSEAVLAGVSAGVVAIDSVHAVTLYNRSARQLLQWPSGEEVLGKTLKDILPEGMALLEEVTTRPGKPVQGNIVITRGEKNLTLKVHITAQEYEGEVESYVITFDDITPVVAAQRHAAWSDVARRVAHEIKNPLTPIQLSAQRLKRKYMKQVEEVEQENFARYTDTIIRHVGDIGNMVEEFVSFARMPAPVFTHESIGELLTKIVLLEENAHPKINYAVDVPAEEIFVHVDASQIRQVITNLVKNAAEAIETRHIQRGGDPEEQAAGIISVVCAERNASCIVEVKDDGCGFPPDQIHRLLEPYVTTRAKGTGLGLAIVKKIMEDHKGRIELENRPEGGGLVRLVFPMDSRAENVDNQRNALPA